MSRGEASKASSQSTLASIANRVGVSVNTVSRALRAPHTVRVELRLRINEVIEELNYVPNRLAGGLAGTQSDVVGVVVTSLYYSEFARVVDTLQSELLASNLQVLLANTRYDSQQELRLVRSILSWRPAAIAIIGVDHPPKVNELLRASGVPIIEMWDLGGSVIDSAVGLDHVAIGAVQAAHLIEGGCRHIAFVGSMRPNDTRAQKRAQGMAERLLQSGLAPATMVTRAEGGHPDLGEVLTEVLLQCNPETDGIVCNSDAVAFGVLRYLRKIGKRVPADISVVGFGDSEASSCMTPSLTTVQPDRERIGRITAETIIDRINGGQPRTVAVQWSLLFRDSSRRA